MNEVSETSDLDAVASRWIARRDRGMNAAEAAEFAGWLKNPRHAAAFARCESLWQALPSLNRLSTSELASLMPRKRRRLAPVVWLGTATAAAAAAVAMILMPRSPVSTWPASTVVQTFSAPANEGLRVGLSDGSVVLLDRGSRISFGNFSSGRQVRLFGGEAHFTVAKTSARPFIVHVGDVAVRDIGTAFDVSFAPDRVAVVVTEGKVELRSALAPLLLTAGQRAVVHTISAATPIEVATLAPDDIGQMLAWKSRRLVFDRTPLSEAVIEFNRCNVRQLVIGDASIAPTLIAGSVQSDNLDGFVRLLESGFGLAAEFHDDEIVLRKGR